MADALLTIAIYMQDLAGGGVERLTLDLAREFRARGHRVTLLLHARRGELIDLLPDDLDVVAFGTRRVLNDIGPIARYLRRERPDVLLSSLNHNNIVALLARLWARGTTRVFICQHNALSREAAELGSWKYAVVPRCYRLLSPVAAGIVAVSEGVADDIAATCGIRRDRITAIANPVITPDFAARAMQPLTHPWFDDTAVPVYLTAGRMVAQKDHATLLRAFALHCADGRPARLMILGDGPLRDELVGLARSLGIADRVAMPGFVGNPLPFMRRAAAFVLTSRYEGFGNVLVEALGVGTPVVSVDCRFGPAEILEGGRYGRLVAMGDMAGLAQALSPELRAMWPAEVLQGRARAFTVEVGAERYLELMGRKR
jgi:glycosyltransferase involved in cell wall biosynthesis